MASSLTSLLLLASILPIGHALEVTPGSSCAPLCLDSPGDGNGFDADASNTNSSDIICQDLDYSTEERGSKFQACIECLQKSEKVNETESDLSWLLFNIRYAVGSCLFSFGLDEEENAGESDGDDDGTEERPNTPCQLSYACQPLEDAILEDDMDPVNHRDYGYCTASDDIFAGRNLDSCVQCLQASTSFYVSNFLIALKGACVQRPEPGQLLDLTGSMFSRIPINFTVPTANDTSLENNTATSSTLTQGAIVGIAVGAALLVVGLGVFVWIYCRGKRRAKAYGKPDDSPISQDEMTAAGNIGKHWRNTPSPPSSIEMRGTGSTNGDYYDDMEEAMAGRSRLASGAHRMYRPGIVSRSRDSTPAPAPYDPNGDRRSSRNSQNSNPRTNSASGWVSTVEEEPRGHIVTHSRASSFASQPQAAQAPPAKAKAQSQYTSDKLPNGQPMPPPPPPARRRSVLALKMPSKSRRTPATYDPSPIGSDKGEPVQWESSKMAVSGPMDNLSRSPRFKEIAFKGGVVSNEKNKKTETSPLEGESSNLDTGKSSYWG